jgi:hypothetical protein
MLTKDIMRAHFTLKSIPVLYLFHSLLSPAYGDINFCSRSASESAFKKLHEEYYGYLKKYFEEFKDYPNADDLVENLKQIPSRLKVFHHYETFLKTHKDNKKILKYFPNEYISELILNKDETVYHGVLEALFKRLNPLRGDLESDIERALTDALDGFVPKSSIPKRVSALLAFKNKQVSLKNFDEFKYAIGEMDLKEVQTLVYGSNPLKPSPESLLGRYIQESGAQTVIRKFKQGPGKNTAFGPNRLVVAVSEKSFEIYQKYFSRAEFLVHVHTPNQGTLLLSHNGKAGSYAQLDDPTGDMDSDSMDEDQEVDEDSEDDSENS